MMTLFCTEHAENREASRGIQRTFIEKNLALIIGFLLS
jgi:hypothetical protein